MTVRDEAVAIASDGERLPGTLVLPPPLPPGVLFVQGWGSSQDNYLPRAREIAALGCVCLTFEPRGVSIDDPRHGAVTREDNLRDVLAAYDLLAGRPGVDASAVAVVGSSYGAYLAAVLASLRPVRWLALRVPALYKDENWHTPKARLGGDELDAYRRERVPAESNRALRACAAFRGDVLLVESGRDGTIPHPVIANYRAAFEAVRSLTYRVIADADHGLSEPRWQRAYTALLVGWMREMVLGAREGGAAPEVHMDLAPAPRRGPPTPA